LNPVLLLSTISEKMSQDDDNKRHHHTRQEHMDRRNKRLKKDATITPWKDEWELENVGRALTGDETTMSIQEALERVAVWKARSSLEQLPHAIETTASLAQVSWRDSTLTSSAIELRLAYSAVVVRCINGFADVLQQQRSMAASVSILCGQLGIPSWLVDVRHEASHNALPTLGVLRLAASTLLEFLKSQYWIPMCDSWTIETEQAQGETPPKNQQEQAMEYLVQYKAAATAAATAATEVASAKAAASSAKLGRNKKSSSPPPPPPRKESFDTFGDSSDDDWDDPILGSVWGQSMGTSANRFAALQPVKKPKPKEKEKEKKKQPKKKKDQKTASDFCKDFVKNVQIELGFPTLLTFLVWGGMGGAPSGRGVLIPGSPVAFPASDVGIQKARDRYSSLILFVCRAWPGFAHALLVHLVDFVLSVEDGVLQQAELDSGSARKLFFLSSWIRFLLSEEFVAQIDPSEAKKMNTKKKGDSTELPLATLTALEMMRYPLNGLCDRCCQFPNDCAELRMTSRGIVQVLETILGEKRIANFGILNTKAKDEAAEADSKQPHQEAEGQDASPMAVVTHSKAEASPDHEKPQVVTEIQETAPMPVETHTKSKAVEKATVSLDEMEALLSDDESAAVQETTRVNSQMTQARPAWVKCAAWDPCSIGTLVGYPV
jgi:hypothetical protein